MTKDAYWFSHDSNARSDPRIIGLRRKHGNAGYGIYWIMVEMLREAAEYKIEVSKIDDIAYDQRFDSQVIVDMIELGLFETDNAFFWSESLMRRMFKLDSIREIRAVAGRKGGLSKTLANAKQDASKLLANATPAPIEPPPAEKPKKEKKAKAADEYTEDFKTFMETYPNQKKIPEAFTAWNNAIKKKVLPSLDVLLASIKKHFECDKDWTPNRHGETFIPAAAPYINKRRWEDKFNGIKAKSEEPVPPSHSPLPPIEKLDESLR